ncbi:MAG: exodeoxyribonuclease VII large subunit, partial [Flavobacteriia bacterium]|nr:exodeoxyribonuclease VII large subunit [Flavobacteriia bacterium]
MSEKQVFTLQQVVRSIKKTLEDRYTQNYWVKAEMHKLNKYPSGHAFPELVQKDENKIVAQITGTIWKQQLERINTKFIEVVKEPLREGTTLLLLVKINYSETFGLGLQILDIDPSFSLGELQKQREETLRKLAKEGLLNLNQKLHFPLLPKRVAIISADSSKGLSDFLQVLQENEKSYFIFTHLFNAYLQGDVAVQSIISALKKIKRVKDHFDIVIIVRGGGAEVGMTCYNNYDLCKAIAEFPLPVLTGIGHSTNLNVAEMVSFRNEITPTKLAEFLLQTFREF